MLIGGTLSFIQDFVNDLEQGLQALNPEISLSPKQKDWLGFCLQGILVTDSVCWVRMERALGAIQMG